MSELVLTRDLPTGVIHYRTVAGDHLIIGPDCAPKQTDPFDIPDAEEILRTPREKFDPVCIPRDSEESP
jgi:hypothetical protein